MIILGVISLRKWWPKIKQRWPKTVHLPYLASTFHLFEKIVYFDTKGQNGVSRSARETWSGPEKPRRCRSNTCGFTRNMVRSAGKKRPRDKKAEEKWLKEKMAERKNGQRTKRPKNKKPTSL